MTIASNKPSHFERLNSNLLFLKKRAIDINEQFSELACYPEVCIEQAYTNYLVSCSTLTLMEEVIRCSKLIPNDPCSQILIPYMEQHIKEETNHDEWCLDDLEVLGVSREKIKKRTPTPNIAAMIGSQFYWIKLHHPVAFMGYLACLEVNHPTVDYVETLINTSGLPAKGFNSLMHHAKVDIHHKEDIINLLNNLPLTEEQFRIVEMSAFQTYRYAALVMEDICKVAPKTK